MGRPARILDDDLADRLRAHMAAQGHSAAQVGRTLGVDRATISRSLKSSSFSGGLRPRIWALLDSEGQAKAPPSLLREALRLLRISDRLRVDAERMIVEALDRSTDGE